MASAVPPQPATQAALAAPDCYNLAMSKLLRRMVGEAQYSKWKPLGHRFDYLWWVVRGKPVRSPHLLKQMTVAEYGRRYGLRTLVETGTYYGEMVAPMRKHFDRIYSIELEPQLAEISRQRFGGDPSITVLEGDSQVLVPKVVAELKAPAVFWLDAGYYGWPELATDKSRLTVEFEAILRHPVPGHVILMDDARGLNGQNGALTVEELTAYIAREFPERQVAVKHDILRITSNQYIPL